MERPARLPFERQGLDELPYQFRRPRGLQRGLQQLAVQHGLAGFVVRPAFVRQREADAGPGMRDQQHGIGDRPVHQLCNPAGTGLRAQRDAQDGDLEVFPHFVPVGRDADRARLQRGQPVEVVDAVVLKIINDLDSEGLARELAPAVREGLQGLALENILIELVRMLGEERHAKRILHSVLSISEQVLQSPAMQQVLLDNIKVLRKEYEGESAGRAFVLSALGLDDKEILAIFNEKAKKGIKDLLSEQTEGYARLKAGFEGMVLSFSNDASLRGVLGEWKERWLEQMDIEGLIASWIENALKGEAPFWLPNLNAFVEQRIDGFVHSENWQHRFDKMLKDLIESELTKHHELIPGLIRERLDEFSDDDLVQFVEDKVQDDLQMIRINGSIVGSLVGMGLYLLVWAAERVWGI